MAVDSKLVKIRASSVNFVKSTDLETKAHKFHPLGINENNIL